MQPYDFSKTRPRLVTNQNCMDTKGCRTVDAPNRTLRAWLMLACAVLGLHGCSPSQSETLRPEYFEDRTIRIIVPFGPGGGFDVHARLLAQRLGRHIPGAPTVVVENMPGAGGLVAAKHFAHRAEPDGLTLGMFSTGLVLQELVTRTKATALDSRVEQFAVVGSPSPDSTVCFFSATSRVTDYEAWASAAPAPRMGATGPGSGSYVSTMIVTHALGLPIHPVVGYRGTAEIKQAMESGEVDGSCMSGSSFQTLYGPRHAHVVVLQVGSEQATGFAQVPAALEFAPNDRSRDLLLALARMREIGRFYALPPDTPSELVTVLRTAFLKTMSDPEFLRDAATARLNINPMTGDEVASNITALLALSEETRDRLAQIVGLTPE